MMRRISVSGANIGTSTRRLAAAALVIGTLLGGHPDVGAQTQTAAVPLTVDEAVSRALVHSQRLAEARAREEGARAAVETRRAAERPTVSLSASYARTNYVDEFGVPQANGTLRIIYPDIPNNYLTRAAMQWPIYTAGRTDALIRAAEAESRATSAEIEVARADLRLEVVRAYWALVTSIEATRVVEEAVARADADLRDVRSRYDAGFIPPNEVSSVEAQRARQQMQLIEARNLRSSVAEDLRRLTGLESAITPIESLNAITTAAAATVEAPRAADVNVLTSSQRAELVALDERIAAATERLDAIRAGRRPSAAFTGAVDYANPNPRIFPRAERWQSSWEVGVSASWTVWDGGRTAAEAAEASATVRALQARRADLESIYATEVRQRRLDVDSARAQLEAAKVSVASAAEARRVVGERFNVGVATSTELLDAQVALLQAELDRTRALASIRLAEARLARALGN